MMNQEEASWRLERDTTLSQARSIVFKVGSAVITNEQGLDETRLQALAAQIISVWRALPSRKLVLVTSGAVACGKAILAKFNKDYTIAGLSAKQAVAAIGQAQLMHAWDRVFLPYTQPTAQVLLTREDLHARTHFLNIRNTFAELLDMHILPIVNENDTVSVKELTFGDNDSLASLLVNLVDAELCVNLTSAQGVFACDPKKDPHAKILTHIEDVANLNLTEMCGSKTHVGTGGMYSKLRAARRCAQLGVPTLILSGREPELISQAFTPGSTLGTWICKQKSPIPRRKYWLAYQDDPQGSLTIDAGAAEALLHGGSSLLPQGIRELTGDFAKGALVKIVSADNELGVGLSNYSAKELLEIIGLKRIEVAAKLGNAHYPCVIHRDNMVLHAVV